MKKILSGIDIVTSSCKVAVFNANGEIIGQSGKANSVFSSSLTTQNKIPGNGESVSAYSANEMVIGIVMKKLHRYETMTFPFLKSKWRGWENLFNFPCMINLSVSDKKKDFSIAVVRRCLC